MENKSSTLDKIREINPLGISNNILILRLNRILNETPAQAFKSLDSTYHKSPLTETAQQELGQLLTKGQSQQSDKPQLKQEYLSYYLNKFGVESPQNIPTKQQGVLAQLELFKQRSQSRKQAINQTRAQFSSAVIKQADTPSEQKKTFIKTVVDNIITKGKELGNHIRRYDVNGYKTQLRLQDNKQILGVERSNPQPTQLNPAIIPEKSGSQEFNILQDNLEQLEAAQITQEALLQQRQLSSRLQQRKQQKNTNPEIGD